MDWFKLNSRGVLRGSLSEASCLTQLIWIKFLAMANETRDRDGFLRRAYGHPYSLDYIAQVCNVTRDELDIAIKDFTSDIRDGQPRIQFTEDGSIFLTNWKKYQGSQGKDAIIQEQSNIIVQNAIRPHYTGTIPTRE